MSIHITQYFKILCYFFRCVNYGTHTINTVWINRLRVAHICIYFTTFGFSVSFIYRYGLSYTTFAYSNMAAEKTGEHQVTVSFDIENTGKMDASEVAQVYVHDVQSSVPRPLKELKGYEKVFLKKGEKKRVSVVLDEDAFSFYDMNQHRFVVEKGDFEILVGPASSQLPLKATIEL